MKLPNAERAVVPERKIVAYLLNPTHPAGGSKAHFFLSFRFNAAHWRELADALAQHARANEVAETEQTPHGVRYVVDGPLKGRIWSVPPWRRGVAFRLQKPGKGEWADLQPPWPNALVHHQPPGTAPRSLLIHAGYTPDTHRRLKLNLRCVSGGDTERLRRGAAGVTAHPLPKL